MLQLKFCSVDCEVDILLLAFPSEKAKTIHQEMRRFGLRKKATTIGNSNFIETLKKMRFVEYFNFNACFSCAGVWVEWLGAENIDSVIDCCCDL